MNDVYSLGVTVYYMMFAEFPYIGHKHLPARLSEFVKTLGNAQLQLPPQSFHYGCELLDLLQSMLEKDPTLRCTWEYIFLQTAKMKKLIQRSSQQNHSCIAKGNHVTPQKNS